MATDTPPTNSSWRTYAPILVLLFLTIAWIVYGQLNSNEPSPATPPAQPPSHIPEPSEALMPSAAPVEEPQSVPEPLPASTVGAFERNAYLEKYVREMRSKDYQVEIETPRPDAQMRLENGAYLFALKGKISGMKKLPPVQVLIFTNQPEAFEAYQPVFRQELFISNTTGEDIFSFRANLAMPAGRYYYLIETTTDGALLAADGFEVR